jgi:predicted metalloendopeptidase
MNARQRLVAQYDAFSPMRDGMHVNGQLTLGENIGDLSGLAVAYQAYQISLRRPPAPVLDGFTAISASSSAGPRSGRASTATTNCASA